MRTKVTSMQKDIEFGKEQMLRRNEEYDSAIEVMASAHRASEDARLAALQELETKKYELASLEVSLRIF